MPTGRQFRNLFIVVALLGGPLLAAELFFRRVAPGQAPGVYLETDRAYRTTLLETDRALYTLIGYAPGEVGSSRAAIERSPMPTGGRRLAFYVVGQPDSALIKAGRTAQLWCFTVDGVDDRFRDTAVRVPATVTEINPGALRISADELDNAWGAVQVAFQEYERGLARSSRPRQSIEVMIGLEIHETPTAPPSMYSVRMGPPR